MPAANKDSKRAPESRDRQTQLTRECLQALDHLRNALDHTPPHSHGAHVLMEQIRQLATFVDANHGPRSGR